MMLDLEVAAADHDLCSVMQQESTIILCETIRNQINMSIVCCYETQKQKHCRKGSPIFSLVFFNSLNHPRGTHP